MDLSIVVPAYNEAANLPILLRALGEFVAAADFAVEVIVVDDGSADETGRVLQAETAQRPWLKTLTLSRNSGMGAALRRGTAEAVHPLVAWVMADLSDRLDDLFVMRQQMSAGTDLVVASRAAPGGDYGDFVGAKARGSRWLSRLARWLLRLPISDSTNAFRMFRRELFAAWHLRQDGFAISLEMVLRAAALGRGIREIPTTYRVRRRGAAHFPVVRMGALYLALILRERVRRGA